MYVSTYECSNALSIYIEGVCEETGRAAEAAVAS